MWLSWWRIHLQRERPEFHHWVAKIPGEENDNPPQYPCLGNHMDRGVWWATGHKAAKESDTS